MQEKSVTAHSHRWVCEQASGMLGEIKTRTPLKASDILLIQQDASQIAQVCPGGIVRCSECTEIFPGGKTATGRKRIDFRVLKQRLQTK